MEHQKRLYFTIFLNLIFPNFPIFSLNCVCCHLFSADNFSVFMYNFIHFDSMKFILNHIDSPQIPAKELLNFKTKTIQLLLPNRVVNIGPDVQWNVSKHRICKLSTTDCFSGNIWLWLLSQNDSSKMAPFWHQNI